MPAKWNVWLVTKDEPPFKYMGNLSEDEAQFYVVQALVKVFDGSDADAFVVTRSDYAPAINLVKVQ